jgi:hypothetical protein
VQSSGLPQISPAHSFSVKSLMPRPVSMRLEVSKLKPEPARVTAVERLAARGAARTPARTTDAPLKEDLLAATTALAATQ